MKKKGLLGPQLEEEIIELVKETLKKENREITKAELKQLIKEVMPNIEAMIAKNVKQHLRTIAVDLLDKTSGE
jgi:2-keto-4-pentenoate hydratase